MKPLIFWLLLSGCAVGMAASGNKEMDDSVVFPGSNRAVIIFKLGAPEDSRELPDGVREDSYVITMKQVPVGLGHMLL